MAIFEDNILKDEEILGGFNPGEPDDDTFFLGENEYPGDITEFEFKEEIPVVDEPPVIEDPFKVVEGQSVWDDFEEKVANNDTIEEIFEEEIIPEIPEIIEPEPEIEVQEISIPEEEVIEPIDIPNDPIENSEVIPDSIQEEITIDKDFKNFLQKQLDISKKKNKNKIETDDVQPTVIENEGEFVPVEQTDDTKLIQFDNFSAKSPSELIAQMESDAKADEMKDYQKFDEAKTKEEKNKNKDKDKDKEKKKGPLPILLLVALFSGFVFLGVLGYFIYNRILLNGVGNEETHIKIAQTSKKVNEHKEAKTEAVKVDTIVSKIDSTTANKEAEKIAEKEAQAKIEQPAIVSRIEEKSKLIPKTDDLLKSDKPIFKKEKSIIKPKIKSLPIEKKKEVVVTKPNITLKKTDKVITNNDKNETETVITKPATDIYNKSEATALKDVGGVGEYTIQIYASPSKEDAEQWLRRLRQKNISDGFISTQLIRDRIFYRVRFGKFKTKEEARSAALRLGFTQSWIDRVK